MKAAYLKAPRQFEIRDVALREIADDEVIVDVKACGYCGHDNLRIMRRSGSPLDTSSRAWSARSVPV